MQGQVTRLHPDTDGATRGPGRGAEVLQEDWPPAGGSMIGPPESPDSSRRRRSSDHTLQKLYNRAPATVFEGKL